MPKADTLMSFLALDCMRYDDPYPAWGKLATADEACQATGFDDGI
jgi:hypothetical protein